MSACNRGYGMDSNTNNIELITLVYSINVQMSLSYNYSNYTNINTKENYIQHEINTHEQSCGAWCHA